MGHVWLIGMMGSGKSTVGELVGDALDLPHIDIDDVVVATEKRSISDLFADSEEAFRTVESIAISSAASRDDAVISTGGGAVLVSENANRMKESGVVVLLDAPTGVLWERIGDGADRPLAVDRDSFQDLHNLRRAPYLTAADHEISTADKSPSEVAEDVLQCVPM